MHYPIAKPVVKGTEGDGFKGFPRTPGYIDDEFIQAITFQDCCSSLIERLLTMKID